MTQQISINPQEYDYVYSYFSPKMSVSSAKQFTEYMFIVAEATGKNIYDLMSEIKSNTSNIFEMNREIAYYLNLVKPKSVLYGVSDTNDYSNPFITRNIIP